MDPKLEQEIMKDLLIRYHANMQFEFDIESHMYVINNLLQEIFNLYNSKFNSSHSCVSYSSSSKTYISYYKKSNNNFLGIIDDSSLINNKLNSYLFTSISDNMTKFDIL